MLDRKRQLVEELISHLDGLQGDDLGRLVSDSRKPKVDPLAAHDPLHADAGPVDPLKHDDLLENADPKEMGEDPKEAAGEDAATEAMEGDDKDEMAGADKGDDMSDEELKELLQKYLH